MEKQLVYELPQKTPQVWAMLADASIFPRYHALIRRVIHLEDTHYHFDEVVAGISFGYRVSIHADQPTQTVSMFSQVQRGVRLWLVFSAHPTAQGCQLTEHIRIQAPWGIRQLFMLILVSAHRKMFDKMARC
jgi:hypothetical protein